MLPTNEGGEFITIENVFHTLITRLIKLKNGTTKWNEIEVDYENIMVEIENQIYGYEPHKALPFISISRNNIEQIKESDIIVNVAINWGGQPEESGDKSAILTELDFYSNSLDIMESELLIIESKSTEIFTSDSSEKIAINTSIPKLSLLVHFMIGRNEEFEKILIGEKRAFCRGLVSILSHSNGTQISLNTLIDKWNEEKTLQSTLEFWKERFGDYRIKCVNLMNENELT